MNALHNIVEGVDNKLHKNNFCLRGLKERVEGESEIIYRDIID